MDMSASMSSSTSSSSFADVHLTNWKVSFYRSTNGGMGSEDIHDKEVESYESSSEDLSPATFGLLITNVEPL